LLKEDVIVCHLEHIAVENIDLMLAESPFALGALHCNSGLLEMPPNGSCEKFLARSLEQVVIFQVPTRRL
jgi:hypothetical protein